MLIGRKSVKPIMLAGVAALAYYAYTRMSEEQKRNLVDTVRKQGKDLLGRVMPAMNNNNGDIAQAARNMDM
jgi:hypothetical protein